MSPEERRRLQDEINFSFRHLSERNQEKLVRMANHLAQHKILSQLYLGDDNPEPCCLCTSLN